MTADKKTKSGSKELILGFGLITVFSTLAGAGFSFVLPPPIETANRADSRGAPFSAPAMLEGGGQAPAGPSDEHDIPTSLRQASEQSLNVAGGKGPVLKTWELAPITANLNGVKAPWIRIEGVLLYDVAIENEMPVLAPQISDDFVAYLRTVSATEIGGRNGFRNLIEDMNERAGLRSGGKVLKLVVSSFIIE